MGGCVCDRAAADAEGGQSSAFKPSSVVRQYSRSLTGRGKVDARRITLPSQVRAYEEARRPRCSGACVAAHGAEPSVGKVCRDTVSLACLGSWTRLVRAGESVISTLCGM